MNDGPNDPGYILSEIKRHGEKIEPLLKALPDNEPRAKAQGNWGDLVSHAEKAAEPAPAYEHC